MFIRVTKWACLLRERKKKVWLDPTRKMSLRGGPSFNYTYDEMDPTELQYLQGGALQESHQAGSFLAKSSFQAHQSFSQSYLQRYITPVAPSLGSQIEQRRFLGGEIISLSLSLSLLLLSCQDLGSFLKRVKWFHSSPKRTMPSHRECLRLHCRAGGWGRH